MIATKPVGPEWAAIEQSIYDNFAAEGIELVIPVIPWSDDEEEEVEKEGGESQINASGIKDEAEFAELKELYRSDIEVLRTVFAHTHTTRHVCGNENFHYHLLSEKLFNPYAQLIETVDAETTPLSTFIERHVKVYRGLPCLIKNIPKVEKWRALERWSSVDSLIKHYGKMPIKVGEVPPIHGMGRPYQVRLPLALYHEYSVKNEADSPFYAFEYDFNDSRAALLEDYTVPSYFKNDVFDLDSVTRLFYPNNRHLIIGGERTGTNLHFDPKGTSAWNTLLIGRKKWAFFPPGTEPEYIRKVGTRTCQSGTAPGGPVAYWWMDMAPNIGPHCGMIECIQNPGDTIFIPGGWWHCVINLSFTMAITQNVLIPESVPSVWPQIRKDWPKFSEYMMHQHGDRLREWGVKEEELNYAEGTPLPFSLDDEAVMLEFHTTQMQ